MDWSEAEKKEDWKSNTKKGRTDQLRGRENIINSGLEHTYMGMSTKENEKVFGIWTPL